MFMQHTWVLGIRIRKIIHIHVTTITCMTSTSVNKNLMQLSKRRAIWECITSYIRSGLPCIKNRLEIQYYFKTMKNSWSILSKVKLESLTFTFSLFLQWKTYQYAHSRSGNKYIRMETMATIKHSPHFQRIEMLLLNLDPKASSLDQLYPFILK